VIKNTLLVKAMELRDYGELPSVLTGNSAIFISEVANGPGKIIKDQNQLNHFWVTYINEIYIGDDQLDALATIKSREELISSLQAPAQSYFCTSKIRS
jgi:large subunit ribosomal protein L10